MNLSYDDIEKISISALTGFMGGLINRAEWVKPIQIEALATHQLKQRIDYTRLSDDGRMLGITTYADTTVKLRRYCYNDTVSIPANTILLDERLKAPAQIPDRQSDKERSRRRFTIAHGCAHQILHRREKSMWRPGQPESETERTYSVRDVVSLDDKHDWPASALAAALLIPAKYLALLLGFKRLTFFGNKMNSPDKLAFENLCNRLDVSRTAMRIRLCQLGYATVLPASAYYDPSDIECDDEYFYAKPVFVNAPAYS